MEQKLKCTSCEADLPDGAKFCSRCGAEQKLPEEPMDTYCPNCGTQLEATQLFCHACGKKQVDQKPKNAKGRTSLDWIRRALVLLVAILFLSVAFLPVASISERENDVKVTVKTSAIDNVVFCFDAMRSLDEEELMDSNLKEKLDDIDSDVFSEEDPDEREINRAVKLAIRLMLQSEEEAFLPQYALTALLSLAYLALSVAFFTVAVVEFVFFCFGCKRPKLFYAALQMLCAVPILAILLGFSNIVSFGMERLTGVVIVLIVAALAVLAYFTVDHYFLREEKIKPRVGAIVKRSLSALVCVLMLFSICFPLVNYRVKTTFAHNSKETSVERKLGAQFFESFALSSTKAEGYEDIFEAYEKVDGSIVRSYPEEYEFFSKNEFKKGEAEVVDTKILVTSFLIAKIFEVGWLVSLSTVLALLVSLIGGVLLWQNFIALISDKSPRRAVTIPLRVVGILAATIVLALVIVFVTVTNYNIRSIGFIGAKLSLSLAAGAILSLIFAILSAIVPMRKRK